METKPITLDAGKLLDELHQYESNDYPASQGCLVFAKNLGTISKHSIATLYMNDGAEGNDPFHRRAILLSECCGLSWQLVRRSGSGAVFLVPTRNKF